MKTPPTSTLGRFVDTIEETSIAVCLGLMTLITFANVVARYAFDDNILWALEVTVFLFAWLVLIGASYAVKHNFHIGIDVVVQLLSPSKRACNVTSSPQLGFLPEACTSNSASGLVPRGCRCPWTPASSRSQRTLPCANA